MIKRSYKLATVMGIPIRMHMTLVILLLFVLLATDLSGIIIAICLFASVALHELGHSWVAIRLGGRVHEIMLIPIGGVAKMANMPSRPKDEILIAAAGPATSFAFFLLFWLLTAGGVFVMFFAHLSAINLMLCLFNLLPSFPMDGGRIFRAIMTPRLGRLKATELAVRIGKIFSIALVIFALFSGLPFFNKLMLIALATFISQSAKAEYRAIRAQHMQQEWYTVEPQADIHVSPPPYARTAPPFLKNMKRKTNAFFNDLFKNWN